jgi:hypothetical protein
MNATIYSRVEGKAKHYEAGLCRPSRAGRYIGLMRAFLIILASGCIALNASVIPVIHRDPATLAVFQEYTAKFEQQVSAAFSAASKMWIDDEHSSKRKDFDAGKPVVEARTTSDIHNGSIHHFSGAIRIPGAKIESMRRIMLDYTNYPVYFKPDVVRGSGVVQPDSVPEDEHYRTRLFLTESTLWIDVAYDAQYDSHYRWLDPKRWTSRSTTVSVKELIDAKQLDGETFPEGEDHGFLWSTNNYWFARQRDGGLDLQLDSMSLSRTTPVGFGWWGNRRTREAVEKMLRDTKKAIESLK